MGGGYILNSDDCLAAIVDKFGKHKEPSHLFDKIEAELLIDRRNKAMKYEFKTVPGTSDFHVLVFKPNQQYFLASKVL